MITVKQWNQFCSQIKKLKEAGFEIRVKECLVWFVDKENDKYFLRTYAALQNGQPATSNRTFFKHPESLSDTTTIEDLHRSTVIITTLHHVNHSPIQQVLAL